MPQLIPIYMHMSVFELRNGHFGQMHIQYNKTDKCV